MDLKFKSPKWVGNIYHTFEAICHEVDDFVSQETVKYVENQAQAVGGSVKRFYSNVVQDLLPSSLMQHGKHEAQILSAEKKDMDEENQVHIDVNDEHGNSSSGSEIVDSEHKKSDVIGENDQKGELTDKEHDNSFQEDDPTEVPMGETPYPFEETEPTEEWVNTNARSFEANDPKIVPSRAKEEWMITDADNVEENDLKKEPSRPNEKEELMNTNEENDLKKESCRLKEKEEWTSTNVNNIKENPNEEPSRPKEMGLFCLQNKDLPEASFSSDIPKIEVTCDTHVGDMERVSDMSNLLRPLEVNFSVVSVDKTVESELVFSNNSLSTKMVDVPHNEENICNYLENEFERAFDASDGLSSSEPMPLVSCDDTELKPALSGNAFADEDIPSSDDIAALAASFEDNHCNDYPHLEALMSFLKVGDEDDCVVDITDPSMVTIELSDDKAKHDENCVLVEDKLLYGVSCRSRKHKSYKKILQDAFASRKRIRKEYEQFGILFGDIDIDPSQRQGHNLLPENPSSSLGLEKLSSGDISEWELL